MELSLDLMQPTKPVGTPEVSHVWVLQPVRTDQRSLVATESREYSYLADCECPDDCLRDHGND